MKSSIYTKGKQVKHSLQKGFSLIEIMVVLVIMGLLASIVAPAVMDALGDSKSKRVLADFANMETALKMYKLDNFTFPSSEQGIEALVAEPDTQPKPKNWRSYMPELPLDPWGNRYLYLSPGEAHSFDIYTLGADGVRGGIEEGADITNWDTPDSGN